LSLYLPLIGRATKASGIAPRENPVPANLHQLTIKCFASGPRATDFAWVMNATRMFERYSERAKSAACPACRTVNMLGMMCAAAIDSGQFLAFVGRGHGGDWPDPRDSSERQPGEDLNLPRERG
jgi:hypothetical protein